MEVEVVHELSTLLLWVLFLLGLLCLPCCAGLGWWHARRPRRQAPLRAVAAAPHPPQGPGWRSPWRPPCTCWWWGLALFFAVGSLQHREADTSLLLWIWLVLAAVGGVVLVGFGVYWMREDVEYACPVCERPASKWRFFGMCGTGRLGFVLRAGV